jgi:hypothetical protein
MPDMIYYIKFCEQTHESCRGFAHDDNIETSSYVVRANQEEQVILDTLLAEIEELNLAALGEASEEWEKNHPGENQEGYEGEEYVGLRWAESTKRQPNPGQEAEDNTAEIIESLRSLRNEM